MSTAPPILLALSEMVKQFSYSDSLGSKLTHCKSLFDYKKTYYQLVMGVFLLNLSKNTPIILKKENNKYTYVQIAMSILHRIDIENSESAPFENIEDNYPKYIVTRNDLIQERNCIIHVNILEFMIGNKDYC